MQRDAPGFDADKQMRSEVPVRNEVHIAPASWWLLVAAAAGGVYVYLSVPWLLTDYFVNVALTALMLFIVVRTVVAILRKPFVKYQNQVFALALLFAFYSTVSDPGPAPVEQLSLADQQRIHGIIEQVGAGEQDVDKATRTELWEILGQLGDWRDSTVEEVRSALIGAFRYRALFFQDLSAAVAQNAPHTSVERESKAQKLGMTHEQVSEWERYMQEVVATGVIDWAGYALPVTPQLLDAIAREERLSLNRVELLLTPPGSG